MNVNTSTKLTVDRIIYPIISCLSREKLLFTGFSCRFLMSSTFSVFVLLYSTCRLLGGCILYVSNIAVNNIHLS